MSNGLKRHRSQDGKRQKLDQGFDFSPSAEFSISPVRSAPTESGPKTVGTWETVEEGEILLDDEPPRPASQDPEVLKARLARARQLARKHNPSLAGSSPSASDSKPEKPPELLSAKPTTSPPAEIADDLDVHFSP